MNLTRTTRSFITQFRIWILPLHIETEHFVATTPEDRICFVCNMKPESDIHFMFKCPLYMHFRNHSLQKIINLYPTFSTFPIEQKLQFVLSDRRLMINTGNFKRPSFMLRPNKMYVNNFECDLVKVTSAHIMLIEPSCKCLQLKVYIQDSQDSRLKSIYLTIIYIFSNCI